MPAQFFCPCDCMSSPFDNPAWQRHLFKHRCKSTTVTCGGASAVWYWFIFRFGCEDEQASVLCFPCAMMCQAQQAPNRKDHRDQAQQEAEDFGWPEGANHLSWLPGSVAHNWGMARFFSFLRTSSAHLVFPDDPKWKSRIKKQTSMHPVDPCYVCFFFGNDGIQVGGSMKCQLPLATLTFFISWHK